MSPGCPATALGTYSGGLLINGNWSSGRVAQLVGASSSALRGCRFDPQSEHIPRLRVRSQVGVHMGDNRLLFLLHIDVSLSLSLNKHISSSED